MLVHDAFSVEFYSFLTSKDKMAAADKEKSAGIPVVRRAFLTQSDVDRLFFEAMIPYERSPDVPPFCFTEPYSLPPRWPVSAVHRQLPL